VKQGFRFRRVVGIDYGGEKMEVFRTWNGKKPVYVLDEHEQFSDLVTDDDIRPAGGAPFRPNDARKRKQKRKKAEKARRRNRSR
jgi:hypothetical protein